MALTNAPLLATARDAHLFVDRDEELARLRRAVDRKLNVLLVGAPGVGKTSLLHRFAAELHDEAEAGRDRGVVVPWPVWIGGRPASAYDFVATLTHGLTSALEDHALPARVLEMASTALAKLRSAGLPTVIGPAGDTSTTGSVLGYLDLARSLATDLSAAGYQPVFVVDELAESSVAFDVFGRMRDELWTLGGVWLVTARPVDVPVLRTPPADAFFEEAVELAPLSAEAATRLVHTRAEDAGLPHLDDAQVEAIVQAADGAPLMLLALLRAMDAGRPLEAIVRDLDTTRARIDRLSPPARRLAQVLEGFSDPVGASSDELQRAAGASASRLRQLFHELEQAGVVERRPLPRVGPGRPGTGYVLRGVERCW